MKKQLKKQLCLFLLLIIATFDSKGLYSPCKLINSDSDNYYLVSDTNKQSQNKSHRVITEKITAPDSDGDGIADADDFCPDQKGPALTHGCPDSDNDGVADKDDACPNEPGPATLNGCPDRDNDGIADTEDACPDKKGTIQFKGCADTDGDGIADNEDACPDEKGSVTNHGCPDIKPEDIEKINKAANEIQFDKGKDIIKSNSYSDLDKVFSIMKKYSFTKWEIKVYNENNKNNSENDKLLENRRNAIRNYLINKGIDKSRLTVNTEINNQPINNKANRCVEIRLVEN